MMTDRENTEEQMDGRESDRQADRQTDRQTDRCALETHHLGWFAVLNAGSRPADAGLGLQREQSPEALLRALLA